MVSFGERLRALLKERGMTQAQLADKADIQPCSISLYCTDQRMPYAAQLVRIAEALETTTDYLIRGVAVLKNFCAEVPNENR